MTDKGDAIREVVRQYWGYDTLRPLQFEAMSAARDGRDALVVLPTGGGKSLCYQAPALLHDQPTVVVSPLIALMKDQVDALIGRGVSTAFLNSSLTVDDRRRVAAGITAGEYKLIFVAPERFASDAFWNLLDTSGVGAFAIDEAHCISHWGHDFRGDYRRLDQLKARFPSAAIHAFTATATPQVRDDIVEQLQLADPAILVGDFFRPNLRYRVRRRGDVFDDVLELIRERPGQAGIVYCIRRRDVDGLSAHLKSSGINAVGYHAGMSDEARTRAQDAFAAGKIDVVVATVAFGMGIDRSDIRFVIHAGMPKSIEHYQQETGRAGRDGELADCILLYNGSDVFAWKRIIEGNEESDRERSLVLLDAMARFCTGISCRHQSLVRYFGQDFPLANCNACDVCCDSVGVLEDSTVRAQKIMSAVVRTGERFGAAYVCDVLMGKETQAVEDRGHASLPTFGIMAEEEKPALMAWIDQLIDQKLLVREGEYRVVKVTDAGWRVLRSQAEAKLLPAAAKTGRRTRRRRERSTSATAGGDRPSTAAAAVHAEALDANAAALFDALRALRFQIANEINKPAFVVFSDRTLRAIARAKPTTFDALLEVNGVGQAKLDAYGGKFLDAIRRFAQAV